MKDFFLPLLMVFYGGPLLPSLIAVVALADRRYRTSFTSGFWITLLALNLLQASSYYWYIEAIRANDSSALERLWIPFPLGILLFIVASFVVLCYAIPAADSRNTRGEQADAGKPDPTVS